MNNSADNTGRQLVDRSEGDVNVSLARSQWAETAQSESARYLLVRDEVAFIRQALSTPCLHALASPGGASGSTITDLDGHAYLDFHGNSVHQIGHAHPRVIAAIKSQLDSLAFCPRRFTCEPAVRLAEKLGAISPERALTKVLLAPGGASAMSIALKLARIATGRHATLSFTGSFHGATLDTISIGGEDIFRAGLGPLMPGAHHVDPACRGACSFGCAGTCTSRCVEAVEARLAQGDIGALIAETVRCTTVDLPPEGYWRRIREACTRHGTLLVLDEIPTGLGRTGRMFACEHEGVVPDILVMGKGLGGGIFPLAAVLARPELDCNPHGALGHFTHEKSPVGAAAALATIDVIEEEKLVERSAQEGERLVTRLRASQHRLPAIREVRGRGLLIGIELQSPRPGLSAESLAERVLYDCLRRGLSFKVSAGKVLTLVPPLNTAQSDLDAAANIIRVSIEQCADRPGA